MRRQTREGDEKLTCPNRSCGARLGSLKWTGAQCSCKEAGVGGGGCDDRITRDVYRDLYYRGERVMVMTMVMMNVVEMKAQSSPPIFFPWNISKTHT